MNLKYLAGKLLAIPLLPIMYLQGKNIRAKVPKLPEASGPTGFVNNNESSLLRILVIGESTVAGVGVASHKEGFTGTLANEIARKLNVSVDWKVYAKSGYTAMKVKNKIISKIKEEETDLIVIGLGGNDAFTLNSPKKWAKHVQELVSELRNKYGNIPLVFANMPPIKEFPAFTPLIKFIVGNLVEILGDELQQLAAKDQYLYYNAEVITINGWVKKLKLENDERDFFSDGVHPSKFTYQTWAKDLSRFIVENVPLNAYTRD